MFGLLHLLSYDLGLDAAWVAAQEFEDVSDNDELLEQYRSQGPSWQTCLAWFSPLLKHGLDSGATALHLLRDPQDNCLRQLIWVPRNEEGVWSPSTDEQIHHYQWFELIPMPWPLLNTGMRAVRMIAFMMPWSKRGTIHYRYKGKRCKAPCVQESPDDLAIYFTADRPALRRLAPQPSATGGGMR